MTTCPHAPSSWPTVRHTQAAGPNSSASVSLAARPSGAHRAEGGWREGVRDFSPNADLAPSKQVGWEELSGN